MRTATLNRRQKQRSRPVEESEAPRYIANQPNWGKRVYAICFDLDTEILEKHYHNSSCRNAYDDIARIFERHGFDRQQGSVYFGNDKVDPVRCVLAVQDVSSTHPWFRVAVKDIRMLRIEENNDLMPAIDLPELPLFPPPARP